MAIFNRPPMEMSYHDRLELGGRIFDASLIIREGRRRSCIQGGRISYFLMSECDGDVFSGALGAKDVAKCLFEDGEWKFPVSDEDDEACIAQTYFIEKWNRKMKKEK